MVDIIFFILIVAIGLAFINSFKSSVTLYDIRTLKKLFYYHLFFGVYFCFFVWGDAIGYWKVSKTLELGQVISYFSESQGTYFLFAFNYFPAKVLDLSYFSGTMLYSLLGFMGIAFFYLITIKFVPYNSKYKKYNLFPLLFFMPNLHFWSCGVGKDTLQFFCIAMFFYGIIKPFKRLPLILIGIVLSYYIRPHLALFMIMTFGITYLTGAKISTFQRVLFTAVMIGLAVVILPSVLSFARVDEASVDSFEQFSNEKAGLLSRSSTSSRIDISSYPLPLKIFTFLYRPLFFDINGIPGLLASIENLFYLILTIRVFRSHPLQTFRKAPFVIKGLVYFLFIGTLVFSQSLGNLGIMIRMRNMFLPGLLVYFLWAFSYQKQLIQEQKGKVI